MGKKISYVIDILDILDATITDEAAELGVERAEIVRRSLAVYFYMRYVERNNYSIVIRSNKTGKEIPFMLWDSSGKEPEWSK